MNSDDSKNLILTLVISMVVLFGWNVFFDTTPIKTVSSASEASKVLSEDVPSAKKSSGSFTNEDTLRSHADLSTSVSREDVLKQSPRIAISSPTFSGTLRLVGTRLDDITLEKYKANVNQDDPKVRVLNPQRSTGAYYIDIGWLSTDRTQEVPNEHTPWRAQSQNLSPGNPLVLTWQNSTGIVFTRTISVDDKYLFTVQDSVHNTGNTNVNIQQYALISRHGTPDVSNYMAVHEGLIGYVGGKLQELKYADIQEKGRLEFRTQAGWFGFTDKYWLTSIIADPKTDQPVTFRHTRNESDVRYQVDTVSNALAVKPGGTVTTTTHAFVGPKELNVLDSYEELLGIEHFDLAVDFGWFYFITKPIFHLLSFLQKILGNFGVAILALTVILKLIFLPLANKSYRSMSRMKALQPKLEKLKETYANDKMALNQEMMALYKREGVNPMGGCLPMVVQIPFFFALYKVLFISIEMRHAPFWGWVSDLSAPDPTNIFTLFGLIPWTPPSFLMMGLWPLIMGLTMVLQQRMNPAPTDPIQEKMFMIMPVMFTYMLAQFPVGLVIYWAWNNILTIAQQWYIMNQNKGLGLRTYAAENGDKGQIISHKPKSPKKK
ncbi:MAG: membrane protein insertase YidC [Alphaproteobacteria bacterium]|nr:MAG: membrane protein insertase YidC [Alphaproteobacteria bacterium]